MPEKNAKNGKRYKVTGKTFTWTTEDGETVEIPMRVKLKTIRAMANRDLDAGAMFEIIDTIAPGQGEVMDEMDIVTDFQPMFTAWQEEYQALSGASLGE
jgi:hypothetical protein